MSLVKPAKRLLKSLGLYPAAVRLYSRRDDFATRGRLAAARLLARRADRTGLPIPPPELLGAVASSRDADWFRYSGRRAHDAIRDALRGAGAAPPVSVLDFGCGCGRVARHWRGVELTGTDYNPELVEWCRANLPHAFDVNRLEPPLPYPDAAFDLVYALSVFTHLPERLQSAWMDELRRVVRPGGHLFITTHGRAYARHLSEAERGEFGRDRLVVQYAGEAGSNVCAAYHPEAYVRRALARGFSVVAFRPKGARGNPVQDAWLLRK
jgi:SAM-dependent methyltransferase